MPKRIVLDAGNDPVTEAELYCHQFRTMVAWFRDALDDLPQDAYLWKPPTSESNALASICQHTIDASEWWVLKCVGSLPQERDREVAFLPHTTWPTLRPRFDTWLADATTLVAPMTSRDLDSISRHPAGGKTARFCLAHAVEHMALHFGHVEATIDWWKATSESAG